MCWNSKKLFWPAFVCPSTQNLVKTHNSHYNDVNFVRWTYFLGHHKAVLHCFHNNVKVFIKPQQHRSKQDLSLNLYLVLHLSSVGANEIQLHWWDHIKHKERKTYHVRKNVKGGHIFPELNLILKITIIILY